MMLIEAAHFMIVAYSTFQQLSRPSPKFMSLPVKIAQMTESFVACPQMLAFVLRLIDSIDVIRKPSRRPTARVVVSKYILQNPLAGLDGEKCREIFYWQYLGYAQTRNSPLMG